MLAGQVTAGRWAPSMKTALKEVTLSGLAALGGCAAGRPFSRADPGPGTRDPGPLLYSALAAPRLMEALLSCCVASKVALEIVFIPAGKEGHGEVQRGSSLWARPRRGTCNYLWSSARI